MFSSPRNPASMLLRMRGQRSGLALAAVLLAVAAAPVGAQAAPPANDDFAGALTLALPDQANGTTSEATVEADEPDTSSPSITRTVWYRLTTEAGDEIRVDTCGGTVYTELALYTGDAVGALDEQAHSSYECTNGGRIRFTATASTTYHVRVASYDGFTGAISVTVARPQAPANDDFAHASPLSLPATVTSSNVDATLEPGEPEPSQYGSGQSVWYRMSATGLGPLVVSTCDDLRSANTTLAVYTGTSVGALTEVGEEHSLCGSRTVVVWPAAGKTYYIAVRGYGHTADQFKLKVLDQSVPPAPTTGPLPPDPTCPFQLADTDSVTYRGTYSGGGEICLTLTSDFSAVTWFHLLDPPAGNGCGDPWIVERYDPPAAIADRRFARTSSSAVLKGSFETVRGASGTLQLLRPPGPGNRCASSLLTWSATTAATPPWASDRTAPALRLAGPKLQRPLRGGRVSLVVHCPLESCVASAATPVAKHTAKTSKYTVRPERSRTLTLRFSARDRRALRTALRKHSRVRARVTVTARDRAGNRTTARRVITLRR